MDYYFHALEVNTAGGCVCKPYAASEKWERFVEREDPMCFKYPIEMFCEIHGGICESTRCVCASPSPWSHFRTVRCAQRTRTIIGTLAEGVDGKPTTKIRCVASLAHGFDNSRAYSAALCHYSFSGVKSGTPTLAVARCRWQQVHGWW